MYTKFQLLVRLLLLLSGSFLLLCGIAAAVFSKLHTGTVLTLLLGTAGLLTGIFLFPLLTKVPNILIYVFLGGILAILCFSSFLFAYGRQDTLTYKEDAVVVLGAAVHGETLSKNLQRRLDAALAYHARNPDALIVVTGGKGAREPVTEALAMERYLISKGIPPQQILKEERAASTAENFAYTKALLKKDCSIAYITTDFHIFRAAFLAEKAGFINASHGHSSSVWYTAIPNGLRECLAAVKTWVFGK